MNIYRSRILGYFFSSLTITTLFELAIIWLKLADTPAAIFMFMLFITGLVITVESRRLGLPLSGSRLAGQTAMILFSTLMLALLILVVSGFSMERSYLPKYMQNYFPKPSDFMHGMVPSIWAVSITFALSRRWVRSLPPGPSNHKESALLNATVACLASVIVFWICVYLAGDWPGAGQPVMLATAAVTFAGIGLASAMKRQAGMAMTEKGVVSDCPERGETDFSNCRYLFVEAENSYYSGMYTHTCLTLTFAAQDLGEMTRETFVFNEKDAEDNRTQQLTDEIISRWHRHILPIYLEEMEQKGRIIFPSLIYDRGVVELTGSYISFSSPNGAERVELDSSTVMFWDAGSLCVGNEQRHILLPRRDFADVDLMPELIKRQISGRRERHSSQPTMSQAKIVISNL